MNLLHHGAAHLLHRAVMIFTIISSSERRTKRSKIFYEESIEKDTSRPSISWTKEKRHEYASGFKSRETIAFMK
jgi:hypothetical protein